MYNFKISKIITNNNSEIISKQINVIIGPNNSGKSRFLKDIKNELDNHNNIYNTEKIVIKKMEYILPDTIEEFVERYKLKERIFKDEYNQSYIKSYAGINVERIALDNNLSNYIDSSNSISLNNWEDELKNEIENFKNKVTNKVLIKNDLDEYIEGVIGESKYIKFTNEFNQEVIKPLSGDEMPIIIDEEESIKTFISNYGILFFNYLGTEEKLLMCKRQRKYGVQDPSTNFLSEVQYSDLLKELSDYTKKLFNKDVYLDRYSWGDTIVFRVGDNFDFIRTAKKDEREIELKLKDYKMLDEEGDGLKSFISTFLALKMNDKNILLLDEPESFLHPPLARQLGNIIAKSANNGKQIFISTHSSDLLRGIISETNNINIIRITRNNEYNDIKMVDNNEIRKIVLNPSFSTGDVLNGLFSEKVYISEAENDEEFYQTLHDKLNLFDTTLFIHTKNKQTIRNLADIYNGLSIPNYSIYDFDILIDDSFKNVIKGKFDEEKYNKYLDIKNELKNKILAKEYHSKGINAIEDDNLKKKVELMLEDFKENGIIILKYGTLETNLIDKEIEYSNNKNNWINQAIKYITNASKIELETSYIYNWIFK